MLRQPYYNMGTPCVFIGVLQRFLNNTIENDLNFAGKARDRVRFKRCVGIVRIDIPTNVIVDCRYQPLFLDQAWPEIRDKPAHIAHTIARGAAHAVEHRDELFGANLLCLAVTRLQNHQRIGENLCRPVVNFTRKPYSFFFAPMDNLRTQRKRPRIGTPISRYQCATAHLDLADQLFKLLECVLIGSQVLSEFFAARAQSNLSLR